MAPKEKSTEFNYCYVCQKTVGDESTVSAAAMKDHNKAVHRNVLKKVGAAVCKICGCVYQSEREMQEHKNKDHGSSSSTSTSS